MRWKSDTEVCHSRQHLPVIQRNTVTCVNWRRQTCIQQVKHGDAAPSGISLRSHCAEYSFLILIMYSPDGRLNPRISWLRGKTLCARATGKFNEINSALHTLNSPYRATAIYERTVRSRAHSQLHPFDPTPLSLSLSLPSLSLRFLRCDFPRERLSPRTTNFLPDGTCERCRDQIYRLYFILRLPWQLD